MAQDNDKTLVTPRQPEAEVAPAVLANTNALPLGTRLHEFEIKGLIGEGGFGIVYLAYDHSLERNVALKEYMPAALAMRGDGLNVSVRAAHHAPTFEAGRRSFVNEARLLAQFDHPSLVKVYRFWEANGTAYMVMPFYRGRTLKQTLKEMSAPPDEVWLRELLAALLDALETIHRDHCFHRDIAPDNIILLKDGRPLLLDFGAARRVIGDMTQALTVILKPGYAPVEQYAEVPTLKQGAWTDIYALAAVVYFAIAGKAPLPSVGRMMQDTLTPLAQLGGERYSDAFMRAVDCALAVKPDDRPSTVAEWRKMLDLASSPPADAATADAAITVSPSAGGAPSGSPAAPSLSVTASPRRNALLIATSGILVAVAAAGVWYVMSQADGAGRAPVPSAPVDATAAERTGSSPASDTGPTLAARGSAATLESKSFDPLETLDQIFRQRDRDHAVSVGLDQARVRIGKDRLSFRLTSSRPGYVYILMVGTDRSHFYLLFPNAIDSKNRIEADKQIQLPRLGWSMIAAGPPGTNNLLALVSANPRDFSDAGLHEVDPFAEFPLDQAARIADTAPGPFSPFAGRAQCPQPDSHIECAAGYGAAAFSIEEIQ